MGRKHTMKPLPRKKTGTPHPILGTLYQAPTGGLLTGGFGNCMPRGPWETDVSRQKLSPHCLEAIFDSQLPSPKLSPKLPPKLSLPHKRGRFILFQN